MSFYFFSIMHTYFTCFLCNFATHHIADFTDEKNRRSSIQSRRSPRSFSWLYLSGHLLKMKTVVSIFATSAALPCNYFLGRGLCRFSELHRLPNGKGEEIADHRSFGSISQKKQRSLRIAKGSLLTLYVMY